MKNKVTISDVARYARVSKTTVSNYLNQKYEKMADETKETIQQAIDILGYVPSLSARRLSAKEKSKTVCLIIPRNLASAFDNMYFPTVCSAAGKVAEQAGYSVLIYTRARQDMNKQMEFLLGLSQSIVDGFIVFDLMQDHFYFKAFEANHIPYMCVGKIKDYDDYHYVASDHGQAMTDALQHLIRLDHENIAVISDNKNSVVERIRMNAYLDVMQEAGLSFRADNYVNLRTDCTEEEVYHNGMQLFERVDRPSAFLVASAFLHSFLRAVEDYHLRVPEDISLIVLEHYGKSGMKYMGAMSKEFTRVESKAEVVTKKAFQKLLQLIDEPESGVESSLEPLTLIIGETTSECKGMEKTGGFI